MSHLYMHHTYTCITLMNHDKSQGIPKSYHTYTCITHMTERHVTRIHASYHTYTCITLMTKRHATRIHESCRTYTCITLLTNCHSIYSQSTRYRALVTIVCGVRDYLPHPMDHAKILKGWSPRYAPSELYFRMIHRVGQIVTNSTHYSH